MFRRLSLLCILITALAVFFMLFDSGMDFDYILPKRLLRLATNNILQDVQGWLLGDFSRVVQGHYEILYVIVPVIVLTYVFAKRFTVIGMGQEMATSLGVSYKSTVALGLMLVSITVAATVISVGAIPFIGLVIPNLVALKYGEHLAKTLPLVAIGGACLLLICDLAGRLLIYPFEVPIGLTAGAVGGIVFLLLILRGLR